ncbi:hypothetical protein SAMN02800694_0246 [Luteibacter sp. UNCMF331Sha3.1]|uniref:hypothetical protein n=1 Tax=Luteibacter sp. UNCMF331Sha3.1 TaxID=1502760 RepID=UPI0008CD2F40|nr:hypothetical protein [Luteibacter sp. UNCMF331Sha3.1]SEM22434.1 hypothetical protein SAMN02800694_0246 [Luteibacter sp. UNCMF331Sha3.1]
MKFSRSIVSFALVAALGTGAAFAHGSPQDSSSGAPAFSDVSKDGKYVKRGDLPKDNDAVKELRAHFPEADTNHDGKVDKGEYEAYLNKANVKQQGHN